MSDFTRVMICGSIIMAKVQLTRRYKISAMHSLGNPELTPEKNIEIFGPCYRLHGHDYKVDVTVAGEVDPKSGLCTDRDLLDEVIRETLVEPFHKTNLNHAFTNTSGEALAAEFFLILEEALPDTIELSKITINETHRNTFEATRD
jgi:6-pyruvoyltetrahydropterin/6-carboxytetrahydropterin synthase